MAFWKQNMPRGMFLRSPWRGSHIADPSRNLTLNQFAARDGLSQCEPIPLDAFIRYGEWFQKQVVPDLDERTVIRVESASKGFHLLLDDGACMGARRVVIATGFAGQNHIPAQFNGVPADLASHSSAHCDLAPFKGRRVAVVGAGQSALESAALLLENGAEVDLIARAGVVNWIGRRPDWTGGAGERVLRRVTEWMAPPSPVGPFPMNWIVEMPAVMRYLSPPLKRMISRRGLRPAAAGWLAPRIDGLRIRTGRVVLLAKRNADRLRLQLDDGSNLDVDHALLATGYRTDINKYSFLKPELVYGIASANGSPILSRGMESSVPGLYFIGSAAVSSFGPLMRFVWGSGFAARTLAHHLARRTQRDTLRADRTCASAMPRLESVASETASISLECQPMNRAASGNPQTPGRAVASRA
jgi:cation diffusion facilitator CzcD-associated flavoprotein CzcO